jgi:hypothetical protein
MYTCTFGHFLPSVLFLPSFILYVVFSTIEFVVPSIQVMVRLSSAIIQEEEYDMLEEWSRLLESDCFVDTRLVGADGSVDIHRWAPIAASGANPCLCRCASRIFIFIYGRNL